MKDFNENDKRPLTPFEAAQMRPVLATREWPREMIDFANQKRINIPAEGTAPKSPEVRRTSEAGSDFWCIDVPVGSQGDVPLPGKTAIRSNPEELLSQIDPEVTLNPYRPEWLDVLYVPRFLPGRMEKKIPRLRGGLAEPQFVFDPDNRTEIAEMSWPWGCIGKIVNNEGQHGSAALVGDRLLVTAGHAVPWASEQWWMRFVPAYYNGTSLYGAGVESYVSDARGWNPVATGDTVGYDWAVCRLYEPLGVSLGYFGTKTYNPAWNHQALWANVGYPINMWFVGASLQGGIPIETTYDDINGGLECEHYADTTKGNSGGPMFAFFGEQDPRIIAIQSSGVVNDDGSRVNIAAGGSGLSQLVKWGRTNWP